MTILQRVAGCRAARAASWRACVGVMTPSRDSFPGAADVDQKIIVIKRRPAAKRRVDDHERGADLAGVAIVQPRLELFLRPVESVAVLLQPAAQGHSRAHLEEDRLQSRSDKLSVELRGGGFEFAAVHHRDAAEEVIDVVRVPSRLNGENTSVRVS